MRDAGVPGLRGLGVYGKDGVPGSCVEKTGSQGLLKTRGLSFLWLHDQNTQNINVIHYTAFKKKLTDICNKIADSEFFYGKERVHERNVSRLTSMNIFSTRNMTS